MSMQRVTVIPLPRRPHEGHKAGWLAVGARDQVFFSP